MTTISPGCALWLALNIFGAPDEVLGTGAPAPLDGVEAGLPTKENFLTNLSTGEEVMKAMPDSLRHERDRPPPIFY